MQPGEQPQTRRWLVVCAIGICIAVVAMLLHKFYQDTRFFPPVDYVQYWSAAKVLLNQGNPYSAEQLLIQEQIAAEKELTMTVAMWNPPWTLSLVLPLGVFPARTGQLLWLIVQFASILTCSVYWWRVYNSQPKLVLDPYIIALTFSPSIFLIVMGQISGLLLLGFTGFVYAIRKQQFGWAGVVGALTAIKPHLFLLFALLIGLQSLRDKRYFKTIAIGGITLAVCSLIPLLWNEHVWSDYVAALRRPTGGVHVSTSDWHHGTLGYFLRGITPGTPVWMQFVPVAIVGLFLGFFWLRKGTWDWVQTTPLLMMLSALTACYGAWMFDLVILLPVVIWVWATARSLNLKWLMASYITGWVALNAWTTITIVQPYSADNWWLAPTIGLGATFIWAVKRRQLTA